MPLDDHAPSAWIEMTREMSLVSEGDRAWAQGRRGEARAAYRAASRGADPAAEAMARARLLHYEGNLGLLFEGPRLDEALARCGTSAWCELARADYHLFAPPQVGARPAMASVHARRAEALLPGPSLARRVLAENTSFPPLLCELPADGLAAVLCERGGRLPPFAGTWFVGLGPMGGPGLGYGGALRFIHPDVAWRGISLDATAGALSRGSFFGAARLVGAARVHGFLSLSARHEVIDLYVSPEEGEARSGVVDQGLRLSAGPGLRLGRQVLRAGGTLRWDASEGQDLGTSRPGHGPWATWTWDGREPGANGAARGALASLGLDSGLRAVGADYDRLDLALALSTRWPGPWGGLLAARGIGESMLGSDVPFTLWPAAGGEALLRGAPAGRYRGEHLVAASIEYRRALVGPLGAAIFLDGAWVRGQGGLHPGGGVGLRLALPPDTWNLLRLDLGFSDAGWGPSVGFGEAF